LGGRRWAPAVIAVFAAIFFVSSGTSLAANYRYPKQDYEGAIRFVEAEVKNGEPVVTAGAAVYPLLQYYSKPWASIDTPEKMQAVYSRGRTVWVVYTMPRYLFAAAPGVMAMIRRDFTVVKVFHGTLGDGDVYVARYQPA
ncbi:MAG: hypothetical protein ABJC09_17015, partial [Terriglobia bacterium]